MRTATGHRWILVLAMALVLVSLPSVSAAAGDAPVVTTPGTVRLVYGCPTFTLPYEVADDGGPDLRWEVGATTTSPTGVVNSMEGAAEPSGSPLAGRMPFLICHEWGAGTYRVDWRFELRRVDGDALVTSRTGTLTFVALEHVHPRIRVRLGVRAKEAWRGRRLVARVVASTPRERLEGGTVVLMRKLPGRPWRRWKVGRTSSFGEDYFFSRARRSMRLKACVRTTAEYRRGCSDPVMVTVRARR